MDGRRNFAAGQHALAGKFLPGTPFSSARWQVAALAVGGWMGLASPVAAAPWGFWPNYYEPYVPPPRPVLSRVRKPLKHRLAKPEHVAKEARKPQGPLIVAISIEKQLLKIYDADGLFAEAPVSTGMRGHPTPMGVFSVIQKQKYHQSNIYSGAPMPYMQRITWSGVAMHAGVLPGYPASHGCIRMPMSFAVKMWGWTRMGARVLIAPGELSPEGFSHPLLATRTTIPLAAVNAERAIEVATATKSDKAATPDLAERASLSQLELELKSTVGHDVINRATTQTADASGALSRTTSSPSIVDAASAGAPALQAGDAVQDLQKDQSRASDTEPAAKTESAAKRKGQLAVFISRKDGKLYVRQNFAPLFDVPIIISPDDRPVGTHVFTAEVDKHDPTLLRWSAISMPVAARDMASQNEKAGPPRGRDAIGAIEVKAAPLPDSAAEALNRLTIPADAMARINGALTTGSSIIVSDQGIHGGETGIGTDFIIPLR